MTGLKVGHRSHMSANKFNPKRFDRDVAIKQIKKIFKGRFIIIK